MLHFNPFNKSSLINDDTIESKEEEEKEEENEMDIEKEVKAPSNFLSLFFNI
jgi:hypothetical protein